MFKKPWHFNLNVRIVIPCENLRKHTLYPETHFPYAILFPVPKYAKVTYLKWESAEDFNKEGCISGFLGYSDQDYKSFPNQHLASGLSSWGTTTRKAVITGFQQVCFLSLGIRDPNRKGSVWPSWFTPGTARYLRGSGHFWSRYTKLCQISLTLWPQLLPSPLNLNTWDGTEGCPQLFDGCGSPHTTPPRAKAAFIGVYLPLLRTRRANRSKGGLGHWRADTQLATGLGHWFPPFIFKESCVTTPRADTLGWLGL